MNLIFCISMTKLYTDEKIERKKNLNYMKGHFPYMNKRLELIQKCFIN